MANKIPVVVGSAESQDLEQLQSGADNLVAPFAFTFGTASGVLTINGGSGITFRGGNSQFGFSIDTSGVLNSGLIQSGKVGNAAVVSGSIASGQIGQNHFSSGVHALVSGTEQNYIANGGFWRTYTGFANVILSSGVSGGDVGLNTSGFESWQAAIPSGSMLLAQRWDQLVSGETSGITNRYYSRWTVGGSGKVVIFQRLSADSSYIFRRRPISFQAKVKLGAASSGAIFRIGILQTVSGVSADVIPNSIVSGWNLATSGTDPVWGSGVSLLSATTIIPISGVWSGYFVQTTASSGHVCLIPAMWANHRLASGCNFEVTEIGLYDG